MGALLELHRGAARSPRLARPASASRLAARRFCVLSRHTTHSYNRGTCELFPSAARVRTGGDSICGNRAISYRVADFLKKHPPFNAIDDADLLALAARGRVRFHEPNEYILWQGEPHRLQVFVIQQGTVSLWDESGGRRELRDVRGAGDMLGIERYNGAPRLPLLRALGKRRRHLRVSGRPISRRCVLKYPHAARIRRRREPGVAGLSACRRTPRISRRRFCTTWSRGSALADLQQATSIVDAARQHAGSRGGGDRGARRRAARSRRADGRRRSWRGWPTAAATRDSRSRRSAATALPPTVAPDASVADGVLAMGAADVDALGDHRRRNSRRARPGAGHRAAIWRRSSANNPATLLREIRVRREHPANCAS